MSAGAKKQRLSLGRPQARSVSVDSTNGETWSMQHPDLVHHLQGEFANVQELRNAVCAYLFHIAQQSDYKLSMNELVQQLATTLGVSYNKLSPFFFFSSSLFIATKGEKLKMEMLLRDWVAKEIAVVHPTSQDQGKKRPAPEDEEERPLKRQAVDASLSKSNEDDPNGVSPTSEPTVKETQSGFGQPRGTPPFENEQEAVSPSVARVSTGLPAGFSENNGDLGHKSAGTGVGLKTSPVNDAVPEQDRKKPALKPSPAVEESPLSSGLGLGTLNFDYLQPGGPVPVIRNKPPGALNFDYTQPGGPVPVNRNKPLFGSSTGARSTNPFGFGTTKPSPFPAPQPSQKGSAEKESTEPTPPDEAETPSPSNRTNLFRFGTTKYSPFGASQVPLGSSQQQASAEHKSTELSPPEEAETPSPRQDNMESVSEDIDAADVFTASGTGNVRSHEDDGEAIPSESEKVEREALDLPMDEREEESIVADNEPVSPHLQDDEIYFSQEGETEDDADKTVKNAFAVSLVLLSCILIFFTFSFADGTNKNGAEKALDKAAHEMVFETCAYERGHDRGPLWSLEPSTTPTKANETLAKIEDILVDATSKRLCSIHGGEFSTKTDTSLPFFDLSFVLENITVSRSTILSSNSFTFKFGGNGTCKIGLTDEYVKKHSVVPPLCSFRYSVIAFGEYTEEAVVWFVQSMLEVLSWIVQSTEQALALLGSGFTTAVMVPVRFLKWYPVTSVSVLIFAALLVDCHRLSTAKDASVREHVTLVCALLSPMGFSIWKNEIEKTTMSAFASLVVALLVLYGCRRMWRFVRVSRDVALATKITYEKLRELNAVAIGVSSLRDGIALDLNLAFGYFIDTVWPQVVKIIERDSRVTKSEEIVEEKNIYFLQWVEVEEEDEESLE